MGSSVVSLRAQARAEESPMNGKRNGVIATPPIAQTEGVASAA
jgi:hypothetical protein